MWPFSRAHDSSTLSQDFITRYWDLAGRVEQIEANLDERLDELEKRYKRVEQSERRLDQKREDVPCDDQLKLQLHPAVAAMRARRNLG